MSERQPSWETLNAYVDGELPAGAAAEVARALAQDRDLAGQVASLARLKAATQDAMSNSDQPMEIDLPAPSNRQGWDWRPLALVASAVLLVVIGLAATIIPGDRVDQPAWVAEARSLHEAWTAPQDPAPPSLGGVVLVALDQAGTGGYLKAYLPDLSSAKLTLTHLETVTLPNSGGAALQAGYRGNRGCKVSLLILPDGTALPEALTRRDDAALRVFAWRGGPLGYLLVAEGMDEARLALIAETVHRATLENAPFDEETRTALRESRERSQPCLA